MVSNISDSPTTRMPNGISAAPSRSEMSIATAVKPVTAIGMPYFVERCAAQRADPADEVLGLRRVRAGLGMTWMIPVLASAFGRRQWHARHPGQARISSAMSSITPSGSSEPTMVAETISGPL